MNSTVKEKLASRKFIVMMSILTTSAFAMYLPALALIWKTVNLAPMITGGEFASIVIGTFAIYCGANVIQKKQELDVKSRSETDETEE